MADRVIWIDRGWQPVAVGFCPSREAWEREAKRLNIDSRYPEAANRGGHTELSVNNKTGEAIIVVTVFDGGERDALELFMTIVHEAVHVWQFICQHIGERAPGVEVEAYSIERIANNLIEAYMKSRGKGRDWLTGPPKGADNG